MEKVLIISAMVVVMVVTWRVGKRSNRQLRDRRRKILERVRQGRS